MPAHLRVGARYHQENFKNHAEDRFRVARLGVHVRVPFGVFSEALLTVETTPLEPGDVGGKWYVAGLGLVADRSLSGPGDHLGLVEFRP